MAMLTPSQSHSGGVIFKPYTGNIAQELQFLTGGKEKKQNKNKTKPILSKKCKNTRRISEIFVASAALSYRVLSRFK